MTHLLGLALFTAFQISRPINLCWDPEHIDANSAAYTVPSGQILDAGVRDEAHDRIFLLTHKSADYYLVVLSNAEAHVVELHEATIASLPYFRDGKTCIAICTTKIPPRDPNALGDDFRPRPDTKMGDVVEYVLDDQFKLTKDGRTYKDFTDLSYELSPGTTESAVNLYNRWFWYESLMDDGHLKRCAVSPPSAYTESRLCDASEGGTWCMDSYETTYVENIGQPREKDVKATFFEIRDIPRLGYPVTAIAKLRVLFETVRLSERPNGFVLIRVEHQDKRVTATVLKQRNVFLLPAIRSF